MLIPVDLVLLVALQGVQTLLLMLCWFWLWFWLCSFTSTATWHSQAQQQSPQKLPCKYRLVFAPNLARNVRLDSIYSITHHTSSRPFGPVYCVTLKLY